MSWRPTDLCRHGNCVLNGPGVEGGDCVCVDPALRSWFSLPGFLCDWLVRRVTQNRPHDFAVGGAEPYMLRWWVIPRNRYCNVYLHKFLRSDDDRALHDHPWSSVSVLLAGDLEEMYLDGDRRRLRAIAKGDIVYRSSTFAHRLIVDKPGAMTLFITGRWVRHWGFHCPAGWRHWQEYSAPSDTGSIGRGCGE